MVQILCLSNVVFACCVFLFCMHVSCHIVICVRVCCCCLNVSVVCVDVCLVGSVPRVLFDIGLCVMFSVSPRVILIYLCDVMCSLYVFGVCDVLCVCV